MKNPLTHIYRRITHWEAWPFKLLYAPLAIFWLGYMLRSRAVWFFTPSNPKLTFGGMEGEPKKEMYDLLPPGSFPTTVNITAAEPFDAVCQRIQAAGMQLPFVVKPEVGGQGVLFRKLDTWEELAQYHQRMRWDYMAQALVTYPMEVSVFYIRHPQEAKGRVTGFLHKVPMQVTGDGVSTLEMLIAAHPKAGKRMEELQPKHAARWNEILPAGERYMLSYAANHNRGAQFIDLKAHIDDQLVSVFDAISHSINDFFYGRYDIMCASMEDLKAGRNFAILEYNGCGAEPNHFYDTGYTLLGAYREILYHWKALYTISRYNAQQGIKPWELKRGQQFLRDTKLEMEKMKALDREMP